MSHHMTVEDSQQVGIAITALFKKILFKMSEIIFNRGKIISHF
jgi:hypothetical protein